MTRSGEFVSTPETRLAYPAKSCLIRPSLALSGQVEDRASCAGEAQESRDPDGADQDPDRQVSPFAVRLRARLPGFQRRFRFDATPQKRFRFPLWRAPARQNRLAQEGQSSAQQRCLRCACGRRRRFQSMPGLLRCRAAPCLARHRAWTPFGERYSNAPWRQVASPARFCSASRSIPNQSRLISVVKVAFTRNVDQFVTLMWRLKAERASLASANVSLTRPPSPRSASSPLTPLRSLPGSRRP